MVVYEKQFYPELEKADFDRHIAPLLYHIKDLSVYFPDELNNVDYSQGQELYPYHKPCKIIAKSIFGKVWDSSLDKYLFDSESFKNAICESLSQIAFSYFIRCFAEQIKTLTHKYNNSKSIYYYYCQELIDTNFRDFAVTYPIAWGRCNNLLEKKSIAITKLIHKTQKNRTEIEKKFSISYHSLLTSVDSGGNTDNNGSSVGASTCEHGARTDFKPRSVSGELGYTKFIRTITQLVFAKLTTLTVIYLDHYRFTSFAETEVEKKDMFQAGRLAFLMFLLNASDMHYSKILWTNEGPLPIDLETLFHPSRIRTGIPESKKSA